MLIILAKKSKIIRFLIVFAIALTCISLAIDIYNTLNYPGTDLRNRVVGARLALEGIDPYFFKWHNGLSEIFYDPMDNPEETLSKLSVPPTVIALHMPIAHLSYLQQKIIWLIVQWAVFAGIILIFLQSNTDRAKRYLILALGVIFANSLFWRFHVNSGQIYIVYIGLLSISWLLSQQQFKYKELASGFFAGITASFRPPYILFFIFFLIHRKYSFIAGGIAGFVFAILSSCAITGTFIWRQYILAMTGMTGFVNLNKILDNLPKIDYQNINYPHIVEGFNFQIRNPLEALLLNNSALFNVLTAVDWSGKKEILVISFIFTFAILCWLGIKYSSAQTDVNRIFLFSTVLCLVSEFFIPVGRYSYYDIQWLLPLLLIVITADTNELLNSKSKVPRAKRRDWQASPARPIVSEADSASFGGCGLALPSSILLLLMGLILSIGYFTWIPNSLFFSTYLITTYVILTSVLLLKKNNTLLRPDRHLIVEKATKI